jgi:uncharacterized protein YndB with AHSA1/START domain
MKSDKTLHTSRRLPFSPAEIFSAFESADLLASWWGPNGFTCAFEIFEFSEGGRWTFYMHGPDGKAYLNASIFDEIVPDAKIVIRHDCPPHFILTIELTPEDGGTLLSWSQEFNDAKTAQAIKQRVGSANEENIDKLTRVLSHQSNG